MNAITARLARLEDTAKRWQVDNKIHESFFMDNAKVRPQTWTQKQGGRDGEWIEFETPRKAFEWVTAQLGRGGAQIYLDDVRDIMNESERAAFDALFPNAPDYKVMFNIREGQDATAEAVRLWEHCLSGVKYGEWWKATNARIDELLQTAE